MNLNNKKKNIILSKSDFIKQKILKKKAEISKKKSAVNDVSQEKITNLRFGIFAGQNLKKQNNIVAYGTYALQKCTTGKNNIAFGGEALRYVTEGNSNIGFGTNAGLKLTKGSNNIIIGRNADVEKNNGESAPNAMNQIVLGEGAKGHGAHILTFGGKNNDSKSTSENALKAIHPGSDNFTSLGNENYAFKSVFVSDLYCNEDLSLTLPTESGSRYNFVKTDSDGDLSFSNINRVSGLIVESKGKSKTITSSTGVALITADDFVDGDGRLILDSSTVSIAIDSTAAEFIKKLGLTKDLDFVQNSFIKTEGASLDLSIDGNLVDASSENSDENIKFNLHGGDNEITNDFKMIFRITRLSSNSIEMYFKKI